jgi:hypothetical protein
MADVMKDLKDMVRSSLEGNPKEAVFVLALGREAAEALVADEPEGTWIDRLHAEQAGGGGAMTVYKMDGEPLPKPYTASGMRKLIGREFMLLQSSDIDRSGRGYYFPKHRRLEGVRDRYLIFDGEYYIHRSSIVQLNLIPNPKEGNDHDHLPV